MRKDEIKQLLPEERNEKINELRTELVRLKTMVASGGTVKNPAGIREIRKAIARLLTFENIEKKSQKGE